MVADKAGSDAGTKSARELSSTMIAAERDTKGSLLLLLLLTHETRHANALSTRP